jgi:hypothetical protein
LTVGSTATSTLTYVINFDDYDLIDLAFNSQAETVPRALAYLKRRRPLDAWYGRASLHWCNSTSPNLATRMRRNFLNSVPEPTMLAPLALLPRWSGGADVRGNTHRRADAKRQHQLDS